MKQTHLLRAFSSCTLPLPSSCSRRLQPLLQRASHSIKPLSFHPPTNRRWTESSLNLLSTYHLYSKQIHPPTPVKKEEAETKVNRPVNRENIYTIPNLVTSSRILLCPVLSYTILNDMHLASTWVLIYCATSDWLDGKLARMYPDKMGSVLGSILDPAADKILMTTLVVSLSLKSLLPLPLAFIIIGRDLLLSLSSLYFRYQSLPIPKTFARFWDLSLPSAQVKPTLISKYNTFLQLLLVGLTTITPILPIDTTTPLFILQWIVAITTISSGFSYIFSKNVIRYLH